MLLLFVGWRGAVAFAAIAIASSRYSPRGTRGRKLKQVISVCDVSLSLYAVPCLVCIDCRSNS